MNRLLIALVLAFVRDVVAAGPRPTVTLSSGTVIGTTSSVPQATAEVNQYLGIPFALSPPVRFLPPQDPKPWSSPLDASKYKPTCLQQFSYPKANSERNARVLGNPTNAPPFTESEDCLYLNVFTPSTGAPQGGRAVMVYFYGGMLASGTASLPLYDGSSFAANQDVVMVVPNYRTNVFGFPGSPQIPDDKQNAALLDGRKTLQWVQENIAAFGGDPKKVTIFGQSAGGYAVKQLVAHPPQPLNFRAAILQSPGYEQANLLNNWNILVNQTDCENAASPLACVQSKPGMQVRDIAEQQALGYKGLNNDVTASDFVNTTFTSHTAAQVPLLIGNDAEEGRIISYVNGFDNSSATQADVDAYLNRTFPGQPALQQRIRQAYPPNIRNNPYLFVASVVTAWNYVCRAGMLANLTSSTGYPTWRYLYNASFPNEQIFPDAGVYHTSEIAQVWGTYNRYQGNPTQQQIGLSQYMQTAWANFAKNPSAGPGWTKVGTNSGKWLGVLGANGGTGVTLQEPGPVDAICSVYADAIKATGI